MKGRQMELRAAAEDLLAALDLDHARQSVLTLRRMQRLRMALVNDDHIK